MADVQTTTTPVAAPAIGTPEYDAAMLAKASNVTMNIGGENVTLETPQGTGTKPEANTEIKWPDYLPEKFRDATLGVEGSLAKMAASYKELEQARSKPQEKPAVTSEPTPEAKALADAEKSAADLKAAADKLADTDPGKAAAVEAAKKAADAAVAAKATADTAAAKAVTEKAGIDYDALTVEFNENGELSPETYAKLEAGGIPKAMVDSYIAGQQAIAQDIQNAAFALAGGSKESYEQMTAWAKANLPAEEVAKYNELVGSNSKANVSLAVTGLFARYTAANGFNPTHQEQGSNRTPNAQAYGSLQEMVRDMHNPLYQKDPAFRAKVEAKANISNF